MRQHPKVLGLKFVEGIRRPDRDNAIDIYTSEEGRTSCARASGSACSSRSPSR